MAFWFLLTSWYQMLCWNAINILIQRDRTYLLAISWVSLFLKIRNQEKNIWEMTKSCSVLRKIYVHCFLWYLVFLLRRLLSVIFLLCIIVVFECFLWNVGILLRKTMDYHFRTCLCKWLILHIFLFWQKGYLKINRFLGSIITNSAFHL